MKIGLFGCQVSGVAWVIDFLLGFAKPFSFAEEGGGGGDPGGGGGGGDPAPGAWIPETITDVDARTALSEYENADAALMGLHDLRKSSSRSLVDSVLELDPELAPSKEKLSEFDNPAKLAKSYLELQKKLGSNPLVAPGENATDEEKAAFADKLATLAGRPESPDKYSYKPPEAAVAAGLDMEQFNGRLKQMHAAGMTDAQVETAMKIFEEEAGFDALKMQQHLQGQAEASKNWAKETWGADADKNLTLAGRAMEKLGVKENLMNSGMINDKGILDAFYQLSQAIGEGKLPESGGGGGGGTFEEQLKAIQSSPGYDNPRHPDYEALQAKKAALYKQR